MCPGSTSTRTSAAQRGSQPRIFGFSLRRSAPASTSIAAPNNTITGGPSSAGARNRAGAASSPDSSSAGADVAYGVVIPIRITSARTTRARRHRRSHERAADRWGRKSDCFRGTEFTSDEVSSGVPVELGHFLTIAGVPRHRYAINQYSFSHVGTLPSRPPAVEVRVLYSFAPIWAAHYPLRIHGGPPPQEIDEEAVRRNRGR
jgi:hypothetical protein